MNFGQPKKSAKRKSKQRIKRSKIRKKREKAEKSQIVDIPRDIVEEILSRLPVKSVIRFKAVSKLWYSTISNPTFQRRCPASMLFAMSFSEVKDKHELYSIDKEGNIKEFPIPCEAYKDFDSVERISNSCHGVLLLSLGTPDIFLVNPSTQYIDVVLKLDDFFDNPDKLASMGFCYDESIGDYKAIILTFQEEVGDIVLVASLREKHWTTIPIPGNFCNILGGGPLVNDRLHCIVRIHRDNDDQDGVYNAVIYFNPVKDMFEKVACPQPKSGDEDAIVGIGVLDDCLCVARRIGENRYTGDVEVLKMKEYGVAESWTSLFVLKNLRVGYISGWFDPLLTTNNGDILIATQQNIYRYNHAKKLYTELIKEGKLEWIVVVTFVENLLTPSVSSAESHARGQW